MPSRIVSKSASCCLSRPFPLYMAPSPLVRTIAEAVLTIGSQVSEYELNVILSAPQGTSFSFFSRRRCERTNQIFPSTRKVFTLTLGFGRGNIEEKSGERFGYHDRSALRKTRLNLLHDIRSWILNRDETRSSIRRFYNALKRGGIHGI